MELGEAELKALWEKAVPAMQHALGKSKLPFTEEDKQALKDIQFHDKERFMTIFPGQVKELQDMSLWL